MMISLGFSFRLKLTRVKKVKKGKSMNINDVRGVRMEQVCNICGNEKEDNEKSTERNVLIICDNCLKHKDFPTQVEQFF